MEWLIEMKANIHRQDKNGYTALHFAAQEGHLDAVNLLIAKGAILDTKDKHGNTAAWVAVMDWQGGKNSQVLRKLIDAGADLSLKNNAGRSVLDIVPEEQQQEFGIGNAAVESGNFQNLDLVFKKASTKDKAFIIIGSLCFLVACVLAMVHCGFMVKTGGGNPSAVYPQLLPGYQIWIVNAALGTIGGALLDYKRMAVAAVSGMVASLSMTGFTMLYLSWRESVANFETLIIIIVGVIPGAWLYSFLKRKSNA